jgi:glutaredoxin 3
MPAEVIVYTRDYCYYCVRAKALLDRRGIAYREVDVTGDRETRAWLVDASGGRRRLPQIFIGGQPIGGCDELMALDSQGRLQDMIGV